MRNRQIYTIWQPGFNDADENGRIMECVVSAEDLDSALSHYDHWYGRENVDYLDTDDPPTQKIVNGELK